MVESNDKMSYTHQCELLAISRNRLYYKPQLESETNLKIMLEMDKIHIDYPFYGVKRLYIELKNIGYTVNHKKIRRLMNIMDLKSIYPKPNLSKSDKQSYKFPYLLRDMTITRSNQVWSIDITYIPMQKGFMYMAASIDWYSRYLVGWQLSNSLEAEFCVELIENCIKLHGIPEIINTDQGSQFTSDIFIDAVLNKNIKLSMDGKGRATDNVMIERFWRSLKYENIYIYEYENGKKLYHGIEQYVKYYNTKRPHQNLNYRTPILVYKKE